MKPAPAKIIHMSVRAELASDEDTNLDSHDELGTARLVVKVSKEMRYEGVKGQTDRQQYLSFSASRGDHNFQRRFID